MDKEMTEHTANSAASIEPHTLENEEGKQKDTDADSCQAKQVVDEAISVELNLQGAEDEDEAGLKRLEQEVAELDQLQKLQLKEDDCESRVINIDGVNHTIDLTAIKPYNRILIHGGYFTEFGANSIFVIKGCHLPHRKVVNYDNIMSSLFLYIYNILNTLVGEDYVLIYLHGGSTRNCLPKSSFLKKCYKMVNRNLKKNFKGLYLVHPTPCLQSLVSGLKPVTSAKSHKKVFFINSLKELNEKIPLDDSKIPEKVKLYDECKNSFSVPSVSKSDVVGRPYFQQH